MNWVDLLAIFPFYLELGIGSLSGGVGAFSVFRVIRLVRVFRVFKMGKASGGVQMMAATMMESAKVGRE